MGTRYYHGSGNHRTSNGAGVEMFRVAAIATGWAIMMALALSIFLVGGMAWVVTWGKWNGAMSVMRASRSLAGSASRIAD